MTDLHRQMAGCFVALARFGHVSEFRTIVGRATLGRCRRTDFMERVLSASVVLREPRPALGTGLTLQQGMCPLH